MGSGGGVGSCAARRTEVSVGRWNRRVASGKHRSARVRYGAHRRVSGERLAVRVLRNDRRCVGVDFERLHGLSGIQELSLQGIFRRVLRLRVQGVEGWVVGDPAGRDTKLFSKLGLSDPAADFQRLSLRARRMNETPGSDVVGGTPPYTVRRSRQQMVRDVRRGLTATPKELSPKYFYDERGSELFEEITQLPEYYLTRSERTLLEARVAEIVGAVRPCSLVELGAGSATKTRIILDAMRREGCAERYVPIDVSRDFLEAVALQLTNDYPAMSIVPVVSDITEPFSLPDLTAPTLIVFLGSTIGNFPRDAAVRLLSHVSRSMTPGDRFLLGRSEERRVGKSVDLGGRRIVK